MPRVMKQAICADLSICSISREVVKSMMLTARAMTRGRIAIIANLLFTFIPLLPMVAL
jgi:hypothetical protein